MSDDRTWTLRRVRIGRYGTGQRIEDRIEGSSIALGKAVVVVEERRLREARAKLDKARAELESLRDFKNLLAFVDDADQPVFKSWEQAHKHHADEPYIGCVFCRDKFVPEARAERAEAALLELLEERDALHQALTVPSVRATLEAEMEECSAETPEEPDLCLACRTIRAFLNLTEQEVNPDRARAVLTKGDKGSVG